MSKENGNENDLEEEYVFEFEEERKEISPPQQFNRGILKEKDIAEVFELLEIARKETEDREKTTEQELPALDMVKFNLPTDINTIFFIFLFSFYFKYTI
ncbi:MAG: hypothetical protein ACQERB_13835 [Promethearchaeati archaeon]